jgi:hypothetical protein
MYPLVTVSTEGFQIDNIKRLLLMQKRSTLWMAFVTCVYTHSHSVQNGLILLSVTKIHKAIILHVGLYECET